MRRRRSQSGERGRRNRSDRPYTVGKGKPPVEHQFKKGQSGNPKGRPPRSKAIEEDFGEMFRRVVFQRIDHEQLGPVTLAELKLQQLARDSKPASTRIFMELLQRYSPGPKGESAETRAAAAEFDARIEQLAKRAREIQEERAKARALDSDPNNDSDSNWEDRRRTE